MARNIFKGTKSLFMFASSLQEFHPMVQYLNGKICCKALTINQYLERVNMFVTFVGVFGQNFL